MSTYKDILQYGSKFSLKLYQSPTETLNDLKHFSHLWKPYNPRKKPGREGLSLYSLDGGFTGIPDLDSVNEYCIEKKVRLNEMSFTQPTEAADCVRTYTDPFDGYVGRSHVIRMLPGGMFPPHRDHGGPSGNVDVFRLLVPLKNCNPPSMWFCLEDKPLRFEHGRAYFINTLQEHTVFAVYDCSFIVFNIEINEKTVSKLINQLEYS